jgi:hypothetical protein
MIVGWSLNDVDAGYIQNPGLFGELVLSVRAWKGLQGVQDFCSARCWVLREHVSVLLSEEATGPLPPSNRRSSDLVGDGRALWCLVVL